MSRVSSEIVDSVIVEFATRRWLTPSVFTVSEGRGLAPPKAPRRISKGSSAAERWAIASDSAIGTKTGAAPSPAARADATVSSTLRPPIEPTARAASIWFDLKAASTSRAFSITTVFTASVGIS